MARINIMDATNILSEIRKQIAEKRAKRDELSAVYSKENEVAPKTDDVDKLTYELEVLNKHLILLTELMSKTNLKYKVSIPGTDEKITLAAALTTVKAIREEAGYLQKLAKLPAEPKFHARYSESYYESATFDVSIYDTKAKELLKNAVSFSRAIDRANEKAYFDYEYAENYLTI
jgi:hypothetical protein